jgi:hypothetical protein
MLDTVRSSGNLTLDECVEGLVKYPQCLNCQMDEQVLQFCGAEGGPCSKKTIDDALKTAWRHVQDHYVVGITEELELSLALFEHIFPSFFNGVAEMYKTTTRIKVTRGNHSQASSHTREILSEMMATEIQLYDRVVSKFHETYNSCMMPA